MNSSRETYNNTISNKEEYQAIVLNQIENGDLFEVLLNIKQCFRFGMNTSEAVKRINK